MKFFKPCLLLILIICQAESLFALCVSSSVAYLRSRPSQNSKRTWVVGKYTPLVQIGRKGNWIKVRDMDGQKHWVYARNVSKSIRCLAVKVPVTNLRTGPGTNYPKATMQVVDKYTPFKKLERTDHWFHVEDDYGAKYWIAASNLWEPLRVHRVDF